MHLAEWPPLADADRLTEALSAILERADMYRAMAADLPAVHLAHLAKSLYDLSLPLGILDRQEDALTVAENAVELHRLLVGEYPLLYKADLATSLDGLSSCLFDVGWRKSSLTAAEEAIEMYKQALAQCPFDKQLEKSLDFLSAQMSGLRLGEDGESRTAEESRCPSLISPSERDDQRVSTIMISH